MQIDSSKSSKRKNKFINYKKPFPNLSKCYKYNEAACCTTLHDSAIDDYTNAILPSSCLRKYTELEDLLCIGCSPYGSKFVTTKSVTVNGSNEEKEVLHICKNFALKLWNVTTTEDLNKKTSRFDNCMFKFGDDFQPKDKNGKTCDTGNGYIIPSDCFSDFYVFVKNIGIPYYDIYEVVVDDSNDPLTCFSNGNYISFSKFLAAICIILLYFY